MSKEKEIEQLSKEICIGCRTRHDCENNDGFCIMSDVVAEWLIKKGYGNVSQVIKDFVDKLNCFLLKDNGNEESAFTRGYNCAIRELRQYINRLYKE